MTPKLSFSPIFSVLFLSFILVFNASFAHECMERRLAMDVGSGSLKTGLYEVDACHNKVARKVASFTSHLKYEKCLEPNNEEVSLSQECQMNTKRELEKIQLRYGVKCGKDVECAGVATAWARKAVNAKDVLKIYENNNIIIKPLTQVEEGELGFYALANHVGKTGDDLDELIVFDIGGGSFQLSAKIGNEIEVIKGPNGVESYYKLLKTKFNKTDANKPYFTKAEIDIAVEEMTKEVKELLESKPDVIEKLKSKTTLVFAIGRPMSLGMSEQMMTGAKITPESLYSKALEFDNKTTEEVSKIFPALPDHYLVASQASLIIVRGIMLGAGIAEMNIENVKPTDYIAIHDNYWK